VPGLHTADGSSCSRLRRIAADCTSRHVQPPPMPTLRSTRRRSLWMANRQKLRAKSCCSPVFVGFFHLPPVAALGQARRLGPAASSIRRARPATLSVRSAAGAERSPWRAECRPLIAECLRSCSRSRRIAADCTSRHVQPPPMPTLRSTRRRSLWMANGQKLRAKGCRLPASSVFFRIFAVGGRRKPRTSPEEGVNMHNRPRKAPDNVQKLVRRRRNGTVYG
jgi:hypothetical protein